MLNTIRGQEALNVFAMPPPILIFAFECFLNWKSSFRNLFLGSHQYPKAGAHLCSSRIGTRWMMDVFIIWFLCNSSEIGYSYVLGGAQQLRGASILVISHISNQVFLKLAVFNQRCMRSWSIFLTTLGSLPVKIT